MHLEILRPPYCTLLVVVLVAVLAVLVVVVVYLARLAMEITPGVEVKGLEEEGKFLVFLEWREE